MLERLVCGSWLVEALPRVALLLAAEPQLFPDFSIECNTVNTMFTVR